MKTYLPLWCIFFFIASTCNGQTIYIEPEQNKQSEISLFDLYCSLITFTETGFKCYIKHRFNQPSYHDFLALSMNDLLQFLEYGLKQKTRDYPKRILNLFHKKLKSTNYVNAF